MPLREAVRRQLEIVLAANVVWSAAFVGVVALLLASQRCGTSYPRLTAGEIAPYEVRAIADVDVPDDMATGERRAAARALIPDVFVHDTQKSATLETAFTDELAAKSTLPAAERQLLVGWLRDVMQGLVIANKPMLLREKSITVVHLPAQREETLHDFTGVVDLEEARTDVKQRVATLATLAALGARRARRAPELVPGREPLRRSRGDRRSGATRPSAPCFRCRSVSRRGRCSSRWGQKVTPELVARLEIVRGALLAAGDRLAFRRA